MKKADAISTGLLPLASLKEDKMNRSLEPEQVATPVCGQCETPLHWWGAESVFVCFDCVIFYKLERWPQGYAFGLRPPSDPKEGHSKA